MSSSFLKTFSLLALSTLMTWVTVAAAGTTNIAVLPTTDQSRFNFTVPLQKGLGRLLEESQRYSVVLSNRTIGAYSPEVIRTLMEEEHVEALSFALLENTRISVFFFHHDHPKEYIAQSQLFKDPKELEEKFKSIVKSVLEMETQGKYSLLPGQSDGDRKAPKLAYKSLKLEGDARRLFREFSTISDSPISLGAQIGMARFSNQSVSSSTVIFEVTGGYQLNPDFSLEAGMSVSSYLLGHAGIRYSIPIAEKVVRFAVGLDGATVMANITQNNTENTSLNSYYAPKLNSGSLLVGPGIFFDIPLLGATLRGDLRFYTGATSVFIGTYGFVYYL